MREKTYIPIFLLAAGLLLFLGRDLLEQSALVTWSLTFAGTTAAGILGMALYRVQAELRASQHELARQEAEVNFALEVQKALFPRQFPVDGGLEFAAAYVPARGISGDYYDVISLPDGRLAFAIADISGKGISAAILMSNVHAAMRTLAETGLSPGQVCSQMNRHLYGVTDAERFATFFYAEWDRSERHLRYVNAGHNPPILHGPSRGARLEAGGPPLGVSLDFTFQESRVGLELGDMLVLYSDGITEAPAPHGELFGESRLESLIQAHAEKPLAEIKQQVLAAVHNWSGKEPEDDVTLLLVRVNGTGREGA